MTGIGTIMHAMRGSATATIAEVKVRSVGHVISCRSRQKSRSLAWSSRQGPEPEAHAHAQSGRTRGKSEARLLWAGRAGCCGGARCGNGGHSEWQRAGERVSPRVTVCHLSARRAGSGERTKQRDWKLAVEFPSVAAGVSLVCQEGDERGNDITLAKPSPWSPDRRTLVLPWHGYDPYHMHQGRF